MEKIRCNWAAGCPEERDYHDAEWGVPLHDEIKWFEFLILEGVQAGLSWRTVLKKRDHYRKVYDGFDPQKIAKFDEAKQQELLADVGIIRNRLKVSAAVKNAQSFLRVQSEFGSFDAYIWAFVDGTPIQNRWETKTDVPANTPLSDRISKDLKKRGFIFVGTTIIYALMQATGMVNDHVTECFRYSEVVE